MVGTDLVSPHPIFIFDGHCVLCSTGASFVMRHDPAGKVRFLSAQSTLGMAVYAHYALPLDASYLLITPEGTFTKTTGYFRLADIYDAATGRINWLSGYLAADENTSSFRRNVRTSQIDIAFHTASGDLDWSCGHNL